MKAFLLWFLVTMICVGCGWNAPKSTSQLKANGISVGQFRGYENISDVLKQRLLDPADANSDIFEVGVFLGTRDAQSLPALLGGYSGEGADNTYRSGVPNAMNTAVWYLAGQRLAKQMANYCADPTPVFAVDYRLAPDVAELMQRLCLWPNTPDGDLTEYWNRLMGGFAPESERDAWLELLNSFRVTDGMSGVVVVKAATETIFLNPYFLLQN